MSLKTFLIKYFIKSKGVNSPFIVLLLLFNYCFSQSGLKFYSNDYSKENRTSYMVFEKSVAFESQISIKFNLSFYNKIFIGDIFTLRGFKDKSQFSLYYNYDFENQKGAVLQINKVGEKKLFEIPISENIINSEDWHEIEIVFDFKNNLLRYVFDGQKDSFRYDFNAQNNRLNLVFGALSNYADVPAFKIRNLILRDAFDEYYFILDQKDGEKVYDKTGSFRGLVKNPYWLINDYFNWKKIKTLEFPNNYNVIFNERDSKFFLIGAEDIYIYDIMTDYVDQIKYNNRFKMNNFTTGTGFIDYNKNQLIYYQIKKDNIVRNSLLRKKLGITYSADDSNTFDDISSKNQYTISILDLDNYKWKGIFKNNLFDYQLFHHNSFLDSEDQNLYFFGGYGDFKFYNNLRSYSFTDNQLKDLNIVGDEINPRFYSALKYTKNKKLLLYGGSGNQTGEGSLGKQFYYDFYNLDFSRSKDTVFSQRIWTNNIEGSSESFNAETLSLTDDKRSFFVSTYSDTNDNGFVKLKKIEIENGVEKYIGDSILVNTSRLANKVNFYRSTIRNKFFFYTKEFNDNKFTSNKISFYSIEDNPITFEEFSKKIEKRTPTNLIYLLLILVLVSLVFIIRYSIRNNSFIFSSRKKISHIYVRANRSNIRVEVDDIIAVEAVKDYVKIILENKNYLVHNNLSKFQKQLPSEVFVRVHRSFLINKNKISKIESDLIYVGSKYYKIGGSYLKSIKEKIING